MISRRTILITPVLLIAGIVVQVLALVLMILLWIPALCWPRILNPVYRKITAMGARFMARAIVGKSRAREKAEAAPG